MRDIRIQLLRRASAYKLFSVALPTVELVDSACLTDALELTHPAGTEAAI